MKHEFSGHIFEKYSNIKYKNFMKIQPVAADLFSEDGRTYGQTEDRQGKANSDFS
jgi:hypothetical protein